MALLLRH